MSKGGYIGGGSVFRPISPFVRNAITRRRMAKWKRDAEKRGGYLAGEAKAYREGQPQQQSRLIKRTIQGAEVETETP